MTPNGRATICTRYRFLVGVGAAEVLEVVVDAFASLRDRCFLVEALVFVGSLDISLSSFRRGYAGTTTGARPVTVQGLLVRLDSVAANRIWRGANVPVSDGDRAAFAPFTLSWRSSCLF